MEGQPQQSDSDLGVMVPVDTLRRKDMVWILPMIAASAARVPEYIDPGLRLRDVLPEPLDVPDHVGNMAATWAFLSSVASGYWGRRPEAITERGFNFRRTRFAVIAGVLTVSANAIAEFVGYGPLSTPDSLDFVYGAVGGYLTYRGKLPAFIEPDEVADIQKGADPGSPIRRMIDRALARYHEGKTVESAEKRVRQGNNTIRSQPQHRSANANQTKKNRRKMQKQSRRKNR